MPLPPDFAAESLYSPDQWYIHDLLEMDAQAGRVVGQLDTRQIGALVAAQKPWPGQPPHVPGAVMVQMTGTLGNLHAVYGLGLRMTEGWVGYGTHIQNARFLRRGEIGPPVRAELHVTRIRRVFGSVITSYRFAFDQEGTPLFESEQIAAWSRVQPSA